MRTYPILLVILGLFLAILMGIISSFGYTLVFLLASCGCACLLVFYFTLSSRKSIPYLIMLVIFFLFFTHSIFNSRFGLPIYSFLQLIVLFIGFWGIKSLSDTLVQSKLLLASAIAFTCFILIAVTSSFVSEYSILSAAIFQLLSDFKLPMVLAFGLYMALNVNVDSLIMGAIKVFIPVAILFLLIQWAVPSMYLVLLDVSKIGIEDAGIFPSPGMSIFAHPSILAAVSSMLAIYCFSKWQVVGKKSRYAWIQFLLLSFLLIGSNQRQEIFAFLLVILVVYVFATRGLMAKRLVISTVIFGIGALIFVLMFSKMFIREASSWGIDTYQAITHPRAQLYEGATDIASMYFPLGSGLGTFGGVGASKYNLSLYYKLGFSHNWWWSDYEAYLLDTYWPNSLAESGYFGAVFLLIHYLLFACYSIYKSVGSQVNENRHFWLCSAGSFLWVLLVTPTSPGYQEILLLFFPGIFFGIAATNEKRLKPYV